MQEAKSREETPKEGSDSLRLPLPLSMSAVHEFKVSDTAGPPRWRAQIGEKQAQIGENKAEHRSARGRSRNGPAIAKSILYFTWACPQAHATAR
jgi:hypothetical protein